MKTLGRCFAMSVLIATTIGLAVLPSTSASVPMSAACDVDGDGFNDAPVPDAPLVPGSQAPWSFGPDRARFGEAVVCVDLDHDGYSDLVSTAAWTFRHPDPVNTRSYPEEPTLVDVAVLTVTPGSATGLDSTATTIVGRSSPGVPGHDVSRTNGAGYQHVRSAVTSLAVGDVDGDGWADLAWGIGRGGAGDGLPDTAGVVVMFEGSPAGLSPTGEVWHQDRPGVRGVAEAGDEFGSAVTFGDFDGDGHHDLAIGVPGEVHRTGAGIVQILFGTGDGLTAAGDDVTHQDRPGVGGVVEGPDQWGAQLVAADFDGDGFTDLAVGAPFERLEGRNQAGIVNVLHGSTVGLVGAPGVMLHQSVPGVGGVPETGDGYGWELATGDFDGDGFADLAVGVAGETITAIGRIGMVNVVYGSADGLDPLGSENWTLLDAGLSDPRGNIGSSLAAVDLDDDGHDELIAGYGPDAAVVLTGTAEGLTFVDGALLQGLN